MLVKIQAEAQVTLRRRPVDGSPGGPPRAGRTRALEDGDADVVASGTARAQQRSLRSAKLREALVGYGFVFVPMGVFALFFLYPIVYAVYISFFEWGVLGKVDSVGTENYREFFEDELFWRAIKNTSTTPSASCRCRWRSACRSR